MNDQWAKRLLGVILWLSSAGAWAQSDSLWAQADRLLNWRAYGRAIDAYTQLLNDPAGQLPPARKALAEGRLAFAYQQVGDFQKAERFYREALKDNINDDPQPILHYAQMLAGNGKFAEAQRQYERYATLKDKQPARPLPAAPGGGLPFGTAGQPVRYRLEDLVINTAGEEFSPAFYGEGLVYVTGKKGGSAIETTGRGGGAGYLDLFYVPNRYQLSVREVINADGTVRKPTNERSKADRSPRPTANDSRTVGAGGYPARSGSPGMRFDRSLNSRYHEGPATFTRDGMRIFFTRNNVSEGRARQSTGDVTKLKLYTAHRQNNTWADVIELPFNSDEYSVGHPTLSRDEQLLYFASDMPGGYGGTDLYVSRFQNGRWSRPVNLGEDINTKGNELFPFVDDSGNLYFTSDGRKGLGGLDIFYAALTNGGQTAGSVEHLAPPFNSAQDDFGLITDAGRQTGYFSSNRRGNNDNIYRFVRESAPGGCRDLTLRLFDSQTNQPLDSAEVRVVPRGEGRAERTLTTDADGLARLCLEPADDFTFYANRDGYISSTVGFSTHYVTDNRPSRLEIGLLKPVVLMDTVAAEAGDVRRVSAPLTRSRIRGVILSATADRRPIEGVTVRLRNECDHRIREAVTDADGRYVFDIAEGCDYVLMASKPAFGTSTSRIRRLPKRSKPKEVFADLRLLKVGDVVTIDNIYYNLGQFNLRPDASRELDKLVATMQKNPSLVIEIRSHTDSRGDAARNKALSTERAKAVVSHLAAKGISRRRMAAVGMGESQLVNNCTDDVICTDEEHQRNRRTEFKVLSIR